MKFSCGVKHSLSSSSLLSSVRRKPRQLHTGGRQRLRAGGHAFRWHHQRQGWGGGNIINPNQPIRRRLCLAQLFDEMRGFWDDESSQRTKTWSALISAWTPVGHTLPFKSLGSVWFFYFFNKLIACFKLIKSDSKDIMFSMCCSSELSIHQRMLKK